MYQQNLVQLGIKKISDIYSEQLGCWIYKTINLDLSSILSCKSLGETIISEIFKKWLIPLL